MSVRAGTRLDGRYRLSDRIAVGGMGEVWRGTDEVLGRTVAVKILRAELAEDDAFRRRFRAEARTAGGLPHNGIAAVFDYGETTVGPDGSSPSTSPVQGDAIAYLVMELVPGEALSTILARDGALGTERTLSIVAQAARALHAAHARGVVHRDVKPANLMVTPEGRVKVTDFGIARPLDHEPLTMTGQVMGTAHYLAPELARGLDASPLSDVYALGVVAYECLAGHRPFDGDNQVLVATAHLSQQPPPLPGTIAPDVVTVVGAAMEKDPADRVESAEAFAVSLEKLAAHDPTALDGIRTTNQRNGRGGLHAAQAPAPVPDRPPTPGGRAPGDRSNPGNPGDPGTAANAANGVAGATAAPGFGPYDEYDDGYGAAANAQTRVTGPPGPGGPAGPGGPTTDAAGRTVTMAGPPGARPQWISPDTAPEGTLLPPGGFRPRTPETRIGSGQGGYGPNRTPGGDGTPPGRGAGQHAYVDEPGRRQLSTPLLALLGLLALIIVVTLVIKLSGSGGPPTTTIPTPGVSPTAGTSPLPTTGPSSVAPTTRPTTSNPVRPTPSKSKSPTPSPTRSPSVSPTRSVAPSSPPPTPSVTATTPEPTTPEPTTSPPPTGGGSVPPSTPVSTSSAGSTVAGGPRPTATPTPKATPSKSASPLIPFLAGAGSGAAGSGGGALAQP